jgi:hypothetical protein
MGHRVTFLVIIKGTDCYITEGGLTSFPFHCVASNGMVVINVELKKFVKM